MDNLPGVAIPELIFGGHPLGCWPIFWAETIVLSSVGLPRYVPEFDRVNRRMEIVVIKYRCRFVVWNQCGTPEVEDLVDGVIRESGFSIEDFCKFESSV